jgi:hypothetical protein
VSAVQGSPSSQPSQLVHAVAPACAAYEPSAHRAQAGAPLAAANVPAAHGAQLVAPAPAPAPAPRLASAAAIVTFEPAEAPLRPEGVPAPVADPDAAGWLAELRSPAAREAALASTGQPRSSELSVHEDGRMIELSVTAPTGEGALALCNAWVRGAKERAGEAAQGGHFAGERARLERELSELSRSLLLLPKAAGVTGAREAALTFVRVLRVEADVGDAPMIVALRRMLLEAGAAQADHQLRGLGPAHPDRAATAARVSALEAELARQRSVERAETTRVEALVLALPARAAADVTGRGLGDRLEGLPIDRISSVDARELQDLALARVELRLEWEALSTRLGEAHARRRAIEGRLQRLDAAYERERAVLVDFLRHGGLPTVDARRDELDDRARRLAIALARLDDWASERRPARLSTVASCHPVMP